MNRVGNEDKDEPSKGFGTLNGTGTGYENQNPASYMMMKIVVVVMMTMMILTTQSDYFHKEHNRFSLILKGSGFYAKYKINPMERTTTGWPKKCVFHGKGLLSYLSSANHQIAS
jgi:hypothetical protein